MRFTLNTKDIRSLVSVAAKINAKPMMTYQQCLLCQTHGSYVFFTAMNGEETMSVKLPAVVTEAGTSCIYYNAFIKLLKELDEQDITLSSDGKTFVVEYSGGHAETASLSADEFPKVPSVLRDDGEDVCTMTLPASGFVKLIEATLKSTNKDSIRTALTCVHVTASEADKTITATGSDGCEISTVKCVCTTITGNIDILLPYNTSLLCIAAGKNATGDVTIKTNGSVIDVLFNGALWYRSTLVHAKYPDIPKIVSAVVPIAEQTVSPSEFSKALAQITPFVGEEHSAATLHFKSDRLEIIAYADGTGGIQSASTFIPATMTGEETSAYFNVHRLSNIVKRLDGKTITVSGKRFGDSNVAVLSDADATVLLMAMAV